jgi:FkbM family methyltransferase
MLHRVGQRCAKAALEAVLPWAERCTGFRTARGDYLPDRLRILFHRYEAEELELMRPLLRPGQIVMDVGANVGYTTRFFAEAVGLTGKVYAFEPNPNVYDLLDANVAGLSQVSPCNLAFSSVEGQFPLFLAGRNQGVASFTEKYPAFHLSYREGEMMRSVSVRAVVGDEFLQQNGINHVDIIKIDVEGWELDVLSGLAETISKAADLTLFCEFNPRAQECAGRDPTELLDWLKNRQFSLAYPRDGELHRLRGESVKGFIADPGRRGFSTIFATHAAARDSDVPDN